MKASEKEMLKAITELDETVQFFIDHENDLSDESESHQYCFTYNNSIAIEIEKGNELNYRVYDPFNQVNNHYKQPNGWTYWSLEDE